MTLGSITDPEAVTAFAKTNKATLAIIGPEAPLAAGVADALWAAGIPVVGPKQSLARLESSKGFTRGSARKLRTSPATRSSDRFEANPGPSCNAPKVCCIQWPGRHVIKDDGLAGGKGVKVCGDHLHTPEDSLAFCRELIEAGHPFVIEEKLEGEEFSLLSF